MAEVKGLSKRRRFNKSVKVYTRRWEFQRPMDLLAETGMIGMNLQVATSFIEVMSIN